MKEWSSTVTTKGQVTIPIEVRRALGVRPQDRVRFVMDETGVVRLARSESVVAMTAGAFRSHQPPPSAEELRAMAEQAIADETLEKLERSR